ncbi:MAG: hypothetical protein LC105_06165 [Chitinophagales bacterium]|nr:hypothetical protein [Chitinophagales bacterium]
MTGIIKFPNLTDSSGQPLSIRRFESVQIDTSFKQLTQTAEITLPRANFLSHNRNVKEVFRIGDPIEINLGYDNNNTLEFAGYITRVSADVPVRIRCEDEMWKAKRIPVNYSATGVRLDTMLQSIAKGYGVDVAEIELGDVRFSQTHLGAVLAKLQNDWKLYTYFSDGKMICGKYYAQYSNEQPIRFAIERNTVSNQLNYRNSEDIILKLKAISILANGEKVEYSIGDEGGDTMELTYYNISDRTILKKKADEDYQRAKLGGYDGSFTGFGIPTVKFGQKVKLSSSQYEDRNGEYYVEAVKKTFNSSGYRQEIKLGGQVA